MGFTVRGPTRCCCASNIDDGIQPRYNLLALPRELGLVCHQLNTLHDRFYQSTTVRYATGAVAALHAELLQLRDAYRRVREPQLMRERNVRTSDAAVLRAIVDRLFQDETTYQALEEFRLVCEEAIATKADVQCDGD